MKRALPLLSAIALLAFAGILLAQQPKNGDSHLGTWQLMSTKYGDAKEFSDYPKDHKRLKLITPSHFMWVDYDTNTKKITSAAGGTYTFKAGAYVETIEFGGEGMDSYLGRKQEFTLKIEGDKLTQSGQLSDGMKLEEIWQRAK